LTLGLVLVEHGAALETHRALDGRALQSRIGLEVLGLAGLFSGRGVSVCAREDDRMRMRMRAKDEQGAIGDWGRRLVVRCAVGAGTGRWCVCRCRERHDGSGKRWQAVMTNHHHVVPTSLPPTPSPQGRQTTLDLLPAAPAHITARGPLIHGRLCLSDPITAVKVPMPLSCARFQLLVCNSPRDRQQVILVHARSPSGVRGRVLCVVAVTALVEEDPRVVVRLISWVSIRKHWMERERAVCPSGSRQKE
jgi:hypothetical protein